MRMWSELAEQIRNGTKSGFFGSYTKEQVIENQSGRAEGTVVQYRSTAYELRCRLCLSGVYNIFYSPSLAVRPCLVKGPGARVAITAGPALLAVYVTKLVTSHCHGLASCFALCYTKKKRKNRHTQYTHTCKYPTLSTVLAQTLPHSLPTYWEHSAVSCIHKSRTSTRE